MIERQRMTMPMRWNVIVSQRIVVDGKRAGLAEKDLQEKYARRNTRHGAAVDPVREGGGDCIKPFYELGDPDHPWPVARCLTLSVMAGLVDLADPAFLESRSSGGSCRLRSSRGIGVTKLVQLPLSPTREDG